MTVETLGRAFGLYRRTALTRSAVALLVANAIPVVGVLFFGWSLLTILVLYWIENGIVGFWNVLRMLLARGSLLPPLPGAPEAASPATTSPLSAGARSGTATATSSTEAVRLLTNQLGAVPRTGLAVFFLVHYGIFWVVHGVFVFTLPIFSDLREPGAIGSGVPCFDGSLPPGILPGEVIGLEPCASTGGAFGEILWGSVAIGALALFLSHGASFVWNYLRAGEYLRTSPARQMIAPYGRVVVLHVTIIFGGFVISFLGAPIGALLILVAAKTIFDLRLHLREHAPRPEQRSRPGVASAAPT